MTENKIDSFEVWGLLMQARAAAYKVRKIHLSRIGVTPEQAGILYLIHQNRDIALTPAMISRSYLREPNTTTVALKRMEKNGLVKLEKNLERRNMIHVSLTEKGEEIRKKALTLEETDKIFEVLSEEELRTIRDALLKVRDRSVELQIKSKGAIDTDLSLLHLYDLQSSKPYL